MSSQVDYIFQSIPADVEGNDLLREPQREAHRSVRNYFSQESGHVILQIPVGCGKTGIIATLPFGIAKGRVLVITPNLAIRQGVAEALDIASARNFLRKTNAIRDFSIGPYLTVLDGVDANMHDCDASHYVVANIHQLASSADRWLPQFPSDYFDMIIVDEGHHNVAPSWIKVFEKFPNAKVISLTATPFRGDGERPIGRIIYRYPFVRAMVKGYIKQIHSRNVAPSEIYFTYKDDVKRHTLDEVLALREEAWFRRGVALSPECNRHIVEASLRYLTEIRERTGYRHQLIAVACSVDHARQVRSLYSERGFSARELHSDMDKDTQDEIIQALKHGRLDCIVQVQMLGEGFDHPPLSIGAIFRPYRSLSPYIQFVGRIMRVIHQDKPDHPDNHGFIVSHVGLNNDEHWNDFRELDFDDQRLIHEWISNEESNDEIHTNPDPGSKSRRFDQGMLVNNEIIGDFIKKSYLDPDDDRVLDEFLNQDIGGIKISEIISKEELRERLRSKQVENLDPTVFPLQPQRHRVESRKRLNERTRSVASRILKEMGFSPAGYEVGRLIKSVAGRDNRTATIELMNRRVNEALGIDSGQRDTISAEQAEEGLSILDRLADTIQDELQMGGKRDA